MCVCVHVNNSCLTVSHAVSLTVPTNTAPVGSNPFEDDEDEDEEEERAEEQQTTVNHISVNKEEIKKLVNRHKLSIHLSLSIFGSPFVPRLLPSLCLSYFAPVFPLSPPSGDRLLCCYAWSLGWHCTQSQCVFVLHS